MLVTTFLARPAFGDSGGAQLAFSVVVIAVLLLALLTVEADAIAEAGGDRRRVRRGWRRLAWLLAAVVVLERVVSVLRPSHTLLAIGAMWYLLFFVVVAASHFRTMLRARHVNRETISMSISTYVLIALAWAMADQLLFAYDPTSFDLGALGKDLTLGHGPSFALFVPFSLGALSTNVVGDVAPVSLVARYSVVIEGLVGQFYLAILVARLVAMQMTAPQPDAAAATTPAARADLDERELSGAVRPPHGSPSRRPR